MVEIISKKSSMEFAKIMDTSGSEKIDLCLDLECFVQIQIRKWVTGEGDSSFFCRRHK